MGDVWFATTPALHTECAFDTGLTSYLAMCAVPFPTIKTNTAATFGGFVDSGLRNSLSHFEIGLDRTSPYFRCDEVVSSIGATDLVQKLTLMDRRT